MQMILLQQQMAARYCCQHKSNDGDVPGNHGGWDILIVKLEASGAIVWSKRLCPGEI
jgi:hypothetical protein